VEKDEDRKIWEGRISTFVMVLKIWALHLPVVLVKSMMSCIQECVIITEEGAGFVCSNILVYSV
jgi:hypothetical protein